MAAECAGSHVDDYQSDRQGVMGESDKKGKGNSERKQPPRKPRVSGSVPLRSIELLLEDPNPPQVTVLGVEPAAGAPASTPKKPPPPPASAKHPGPPPAVSGGDPRDNYLDDGEIGRGGMGTVHVVMDRRLHRRVAMKTFDAGDDGKLSARFIDEAQVTGQLDHPNIVPIHELALDRHGAPHFFTMKLVRGRDLSQVIDELGDDRLEARNLERLVRIVLKACEAVSFANSHGVVHRDLKPSNVMVGSHGQVYVMDWGLAMVRTDPRFRAENERRHAVGTPAFMAPEQAWGRVDEIDQRTDVYGLGGILYVVLTNSPPHVADTPIGAIEHAQQGKIPHPSKVVGKKLLPPELCRITVKALSARQFDRYATVAELQADLEQFLRGGGWLETRSYPPGGEIIRQGDEAHEAFIIASGTCEAFQTAGGKRIPLQRMGAGEVFGETVFLAGRRRMASVSAVDAVTVKVITREALERELEGSAWVKSFVTVLAERFREASTKLTTLRHGPSGEPAGGRPRR